MGYHRAGFDVVGVDIKPQPRFPFQFIQANALDFLGMAASAPLSGFSAIHASPPCQDYSKAVRHLSSPVPRLINPVMELLIETDLPWIVENVPGSPLVTRDTLDGQYGVELCGTQFDLRVWRHRLFQTSFPVAAPIAGCNHEAYPMNIYNSKSRRKMKALFGDTGVSETAMWVKEMGVEWMTQDEAGEAIPPVYTEFIGRQLLDFLVVEPPEGPQ